MKKKTSSISLSFKNFHKRRNDRKCRYSLAHFWENCKNVKIEVTRAQKRRFVESFQIINQKRRFSVPATSFLTFLQFFQKCALVYRPFRSFCLLWNDWEKEKTVVLLNNREPFNPWIEKVNSRSPLLFFFVFFRGGGGDLLWGISRETGMWTKASVISHI